MFEDIKKGDPVRVNAVGRYFGSIDFSKKTVDKVNKATLIVDGDKYCRKTGRSNDRSGPILFSLEPWTDLDQEDFDQKKRDQEFKSMVKRLDAFKGQPSKELCEALKHASSLLGNES